MEESGAATVMGLSDYLRILNTRKWVIVFVTLVAVGGFLAVDLAKDKTYEASAQVIFPQGSTADDASALDTQLRIFESPTVAAEVRRKYPDATGAIVGRQGNSAVVTVTVRGHDRIAVANQANAYVAAFTSYQQKEAAKANSRLAVQIEQRLGDMQQELEDLRGRQDRTDAAGGADAAVASARLGAQIDALARQQGNLQAQLDSLSLAVPDNPVQILSDATPPGSLVSPKPVQDGLLGLGAGLLLGVLLAFALEYLDESVRNRASLERAMPRWPVLSAVPHMRRHRDRDAALTPVLDSPRSLAAECFRATWTAIQQPTSEEHFRSLLITSAMPGHGKTTVAANLALVTARAGQRTILVDANLRTPALHRHFGLSNEWGLSSVLYGHKGLDEVLVELTDAAGLSVLPGGPPAPNPWELLAAARFTRLVEELSDRGLVILDSPALLPTSDASAVANRADATLLVANARASSRHELRRAVTMLERVETQLLGSVLNEASAADLEFTAESGADVRARSQSSQATSVPGAKSSAQPLSAPLR